ncbi:uncharacterized protein LOC121863628 [Homarus americanus]|uniref:uncharacterized protein LOC121863628 n=1 Tax=Homarus americanus TaxID=6706 RepID=UPI001C46C08F|nr:uncharacterized protein LOC121863628 [Homarus americanus]
MDDFLEWDLECLTAHPANMDLEFYGDSDKSASRMSAKKKVKFSLELPGLVKQEPVDPSYDGVLDPSADPHCVPSTAAHPYQAMQKVPDIADLSDPESSLALGVLLAERDRSIGEEYGRKKCVDRIVTLRTRTGRLWELDLRKHCLGEIVNS